MEIIAGVIGVPLLVVVAYTWCWMEERAHKRRKRKYDEQMAKYDRWKEWMNNI